MPEALKMMLIQILHLVSVGRRLIQNEPDDVMDFVDKCYD
jgi:hypothetical protein